jgi:cellulose 1,4-beta-cellobiosidase
MFALLLALVALVQAKTNPFEGKSFYVQQTYVAEVQTTINQYPSNSDALKTAQNVSVAYWIDSIARIQNVTTVLDNAMKEQQSTGKTQIVTFVIYDVPDRDCSALASNGEILCADQACTAGIQQYETQYIDPIVTIFKKYPSLQLVSIVEPDSLPNLATNMDVAKCQQAQTAYVTCIAYAIKQLATIPNMAMYLDAAHGGWLGWANNMQKFVPIVKQVLTEAGGISLINGFATNTANYQPLANIASTSDPCKLSSEGNQCINEAKYIQFMSQQMEAGGITGMTYVTDTSRNGVPACRTDQNQPCSQWCNIKNSGLHIKPTTDTSSTGVGDLIDAFLWIKVPGESDGTSNTSASNYDAHCGSDESATGAPQAGQWFSSFFNMLATNANYEPYN